MFANALTLVPERVVTAPSAADVTHAIAPATGAVVWEGRAQTEAPGNAPAAQPGLAADKLARALFQDFPGESGRTITVP